MLTLTEPMSSGFGGGCLIVIRWNDANGTVTAIDGREEAPFKTGNVKPDSVGGTSQSESLTHDNQVLLLEFQGLCMPCFQPWRSMERFTRDYFCLP